MGNTRPEWRIRQLAGRTEGIEKLDFAEVLKRNLCEVIVRGLVRPYFNSQLLIASQTLRQHRSGILRAQGHLAARPAAKSIRARCHNQIPQSAHGLQEA